MFLQILQNWQENICVRVSFAIKLQAWSLATSLNTESGTGAFLWLLRYLNIYFANVCEGLPRKNRIFTRVSLCNILGIYYKRNAQLFYYKGTSLYIPLKILERVNGLFFRIPLSCCFWKYLADKNMFKVDNKGMFQKCHLGVFIICLENIFEIYGGF